MNNDSANTASDGTDLEATPDSGHDDRPAMEGGDRERGDRGIAADEAGIRSHELSEGKFGATSDYGDG